MNPFTRLLIELKGLLAAGGWRNPVAMFVCWYQMRRLIKNLESLFEAWRCRATIWMRICGDQDEKFMTATD